ncbi:DUF1444 domain-containing protein [Listeria fleischmannii]|nr:DUF1444 domain-containing protein [Listeria fleischmannii]
MKAKLEDFFKKKEGREFTFDREKERLKVSEYGHFVTLSIPQIISRFESEGEDTFKKIAYYVDEGLEASQKEVSLIGQEEKIFPVIRAGSHPVKTKAGEKLFFEEHTAETKIFYVLDTGRSYKFITENDLIKADVSPIEIRMKAMANVRKLDTPLKKDTVSENDFYFLRTNDGYDASRVCNEKFLAEMRSQFTGEMVIAIPHQDVLILADIRNNTGYDVLAHMTLQFFAEGIVPVTSLPFVYNNGKLEPIFIMAKNRSKE